MPNGPAGLNGHIPLEKRGLSETPDVHSGLALFLKKVLRTPKNFKSLIKDVPKINKIFKIKRFIYIQQIPNFECILAITRHNEGRSPI